MDAYDVVIVGAGPAGLSAALVLGRCGRRVLVCDSGTPRNARSRSLNGYLTRDGILPVDFLDLGRKELMKYGIEQRPATVIDVTPIPEGFQVTQTGHGPVRARTVLLATGVRDRLPAIPGLDACYGITVHHCPYCDGWEVRGRRLVVIGDGVSPAGLALSLRTWSETITACTNGTVRVAGAHRRRLASHDIPIREAPIVRLEHEEGRLIHLVFADGERLACDAAFFTSGQSQQCDLAERLGCEFTDKGTVRTDHLGRSCVGGIYVVGDASRDVQFAIVAAAEGAKAGVAINQALQALAGLTTAPQPAAAAS